MMGSIHIIGGGLAGLATALKLRKMKFKGNISIYEASNHLGGRCSSVFIPSFNKEVDNGNHMIIKANQNALAYLLGVDAMYHLLSFTPSVIRKDKSISKLLNLIRRSVFNTSKNVPLSLQVRTLLKAIKAPYPLFVSSTLKSTFINSFSDFASKNDIRIIYNARCMEYKKDRYLSFLGMDYIHLTEDDIVVFAIPLKNLKQFFPLEEIERIRYNPIANYHFLFDKDYDFPFAFTGVVGGIADWYKMKNQVMSVTISDYKGAISADKVYEEAKSIFRLPNNYLKSETIIEKFATMAQDKDNLHLRDKILKRLVKMNGGSKQRKALFAGDWTALDLPCTIEASVLSGFKVADTIMETMEVI